MANRLSIVALGLMVITAACSGGSGGSAQRGAVDAKPPASEPAPEATTTTVALSPAALVLEPDGLGPLHFGTQAARALGSLDQALGKSTPPTPVTDPIACGATRVFHWNGLAAVVNEVSGRSTAATGLVGWSLTGAAPAGAELKTDKGIGVGSTVKALRAAYGDTVVLAPGAHGPGFTITTATGSITGELDASGDAGHIRSLQAGTVC